MKNLRSILISGTWKIINTIFFLCILSFVPIMLPEEGFGRIFIDIDEPGIQKINIAVPDFKNFSEKKEYPELAAAFPEIIYNDLDLSGYFIPMEKEAFLDEDGPYLTADHIRFRNWTIIGTELLLRGGFTVIGRSVEVEVRLYDAFRGRQILGKRLLGKTEDYRTLGHRIANEIVFAVTGHKGLFLSRFVFVNRIIHDLNNKKSPVKEIHICDFDGHNIKQITSDGNIALLPEWSPAGESIAFTSFKGGGPELYGKDLSSGKVRPISGRKGLNTGACWTSDGKRIALTLTREDNQDIFLIDLRGRILDRYTHDRAIDVSPTFSPDGTKIAFVSDRSGSPQIWVQDLKNMDKGPERITFPGVGANTFESKYNTSPDWSSRNQIVFSGDSDTGRDIFTIDPGGNNLRRLTANSGFNEDPCWSPDGRYMVFSSNRDGGYHLYIMNSSGFNQRRITFMKGEQTAPSWSPN